MKTDYITPESAADQNPALKNENRSREKKIPSPHVNATQEPDPKRQDEQLEKDPHAPKNPGHNEGHNYDKEPAESDVDDNEFNPQNSTEPGKKEQESGQDDDSGQYQEETSPAMPPEKTRETPQANPEA